MKAIFLAVFVVILVSSVYIQITSQTKRKKSQDFVSWKKYNRRMSIANAFTMISGVSAGSLAANIFQHGW